MSKFFNKKNSHYYDSVLLKKSEFAEVADKRFYLSNVNIFSELQIEVDKYKALLQECEADKKAKLDNVQMLQELVDSLTEQKLTFITEIDSVQSKVRTLNNKCSYYEEEINKQKAELILKDQNFATATQKISELDTEVISLTRQNKRLLEENEQLITQLTELEARTEEFNNIGLQQREQLKVLEEKVKHGKFLVNQKKILNYFAIIFPHRKQSVYKQ